MAVSRIRSYQSWDAISATPDDFDLDAGAYGLTVRADVWGTATLNRILKPGSTAYAIPVNAALAANGYVEIHLPAGRYRLTLAGVTTLSGAIELLAPGDR